MAKKEEDKKGGGKKEEKKASSWYVKGQEGIAKSKQADAAAQQRREQKGIWRFRLKNNEEGLVTFLDSPKFFFREHNLKLGGQYGNFLTCLADFDTCPLCQTDQSSYVVAGTVIDHREYEDREGEIHKNQKRLFVAKGKAREAIVRQLEKRGDMTYCVYEMSRGSSQTEANTGETMEFKKQLTKDQLKAFIPKGEKMEWLNPFDYEKIFAPKSPEELRRLIGQAAPVGSAEEVATDDDEDASKDKKKGGKEKESKPIESIEQLL